MRVPFVRARRFSKNSTDQVCKPSSVFDDNLSCLPVAGQIQPPTRGRGGPPLCALYAVLLRIGFTWPHSRQCAGELLPRLSTLTAQSARRYLSVALSLGSPPAAVSSYPALRSSDFPHTRPFGAARAAVWPARWNIPIITHPRGKRNRDASQSCIA